MRPYALSIALHTNPILITEGVLFTYTNHLPTTHIDYQVVVTNNSGCNSLLASITVKVNPKPLQLPVSNSEPTTFSEGGGVTLAALLTCQQI
jgi:hypothetical protein